MKLTGTQLGDLAELISPDQARERLIRRAFEAGVRCERERALDNVADAYQRGAFISPREQQRLTAAIRLDHMT